ncbi:MAG: hypothetical protein LBT55_01640 [Clostridiaceae bacterium]|jgi:hypothetical protein|nr:hypothetical protein [Clostridiaceae bacterium]
MARTERNWHPDFITYMKEIAAIKLERIFMDKIFAAEFYYSIFYASMP